MKICFIGGTGGNKDYAKCFSGPRRMYSELGKRLNKKYKVYFIRLGDKNKIFKKDNLVNFVIKKGIFSLFRTIIIISRIKPTVIHGHGSLNMALLLRIIKPFFSSKIILTFTDFKKNVISSYKILNKLDQIVVQSKYAKRRLEKNGVKVPIKVILYGVEDKFYQAENCKDIRDIANRIVLYYGDARKERGYDLLLDTIPYVDEDIHFLICIRSKFKNIKERLTHNLPNVSFMKVDNYPCPIQDIIKSVDLVVLPFIKNTLEPPLTLMEVSAVGTPLITTNVGGNVEVVSSGTVFVEKSAKILAKAINSSMNQKKTSKRIFDWDETIKKINQVYGK